MMLSDSVAMTEMPDTFEEFAYQVMELIGDGSDDPNDEGVTKFIPRPELRETIEGTVLATMLIYGMDPCTASMAFTEHYYIATGECCWQRVEREIA